MPVPAFPISHVVLSTLPGIAEPRLAKNRRPLLTNIALIGLASRLVVGRAVVLTAVTRPTRTVAAVIVNAGCRATAAERLSLSPP